VWGHRSSGLVDVAFVAAVDLAVGRLDPFDPAWVAEYPTLKDPTKNFSPGASLCKLGFPFFEIKPTFDEATSMFSIPPEMRNLPFFPIEGIYTRDLNVPDPIGASPFPLTFLETSSPGLRGQSGGPTFDVMGAIWAIQSQTNCLPLGFSPEVKEGGKTHKEHQILNVGMGVHVKTVIGLLDQVGVGYRLSDH
jgi:hypothetical protein